MTNIFIQNKYFHWYQEICLRAQSRPCNFYTELHHILPKSLGGSNKKENLVHLTAREHFVAHLCLVKCTEGDARIKMLHAVMCFKRGRKNHTQQLEYQNAINSRLYEILKIERSKLLSEKMKGTHNPFFGKTHSEEARKLIGSKGIGRTMPMKGKHYGNDFREKARNRQLGKIPSEATRLRMSANNHMKDPEQQKRQSEKMKLYWKNHREEMLKQRSATRSLKKVDGEN